MRSSRHNIQSPGTCKAGRPSWIRLTRWPPLVSTLSGFLLAWSATFSRWDHGNASENRTITVTEYELKAALLPKLPLFVSWPDTTAAADHAPITLGVLGANVFGSHVSDALIGRAVNGRPLTWRECRDIDDARKCHIVFVSLTEPKRLEPILNQLRDSHVLTVGDRSNFTAQGGMIRLFSQAQRVRLEINLPVVLEAGLRIDPQLLAMATLFKDATTRPQP